MAIEVLPAGDHRSAGGDLYQVAADCPEDETVADLSLEANMGLDLPFLGAGAGVEIRTSVA